ncbi:MAG: hypothetical protein K2P78_06320 [Gemmataceae bacterium]|nr:hypothetical protein [Gemmataceae bacterium]
MDCLLQNVRSGDTFALNPHRNLIGSAPHATVRTADDGPFLSALVVKYPGGWAVHGLADDADVTFNRRPFRVGDWDTPQPNDILAVGEEKYRFLLPRKVTPPPEVAPPACFATIHDPDGTEECRAVDHDLLFGRLPVCHVRFADTRLSRVSALLASYGGGWYVHGLSKNPIARNRHIVPGFDPVEDGDEMQIGPLFVKIELRAALTDDAPAVTPAPADSGLTPRGGGRADTSAMTDTVDPDAPETQPQRTGLVAAALRLELWLKAHKPAGESRSGITGWLGAQRDKLKRFWLDTPETTAARGLLAAGKVDEAFEVLDKAIRARPDSPDLLRELYRLYETLGLYDLCFRPLRQIEKLAQAKGGSDTWVLETLARLCERLAADRAAMFDRAIGYWNKLEQLTGVSYARERAAAAAVRAIRQGGFTKADLEAGRDVG